MYLPTYLPVKFEITNWFLDISVEVILRWICCQDRSRRDVLLLGRDVNVASSSSSSSMSASFTPEIKNRSKFLKHRLPTNIPTYLKDLQCHTSTRSLHWTPYRQYLSITLFFFKKWANTGLFSFFSRSNKNWNNFILHKLKKHDVVLGIRTNTQVCSWNPFV